MGYIIINYTKFNMEKKSPTKDEKRRRLSVSTVEKEGEEGKTKPKKSN